jgi:hypothetical protein
MDVFGIMLLQVFKGLSLTMLVYVHHETTGIKRSNEICSSEIPANALQVIPDLQEFSRPYFPGLLDVESVTFEGLSEIDVHLEQDFAAHLFAPFFAVIFV